MKKDIIQIYITNNTAKNPSRTELLEWINRRLWSEFYLIEELGTGAAYCQLMDMLFPGSVALHRVKFMTNVKHDFLQNFKILQASFDKMGVKHDIPVEKLIRGRFQDNLQFLQWFKKFYDANCADVSEDYNARAVRNGAPMGFGPEIAKPGINRRSKSTVRTTSSLAVESAGSLSNKTFARTPKDHFPVNKISRRLVFENLQERKEIELTKSSSVDEISVSDKQLQICSTDCQKKIHELNETIHKLETELKCKEENLLKCTTTIEFYRSKCRYIEILCESLNEQGKNLSCKQNNVISL